MALAVILLWAHTMRQRASSRLRGPLTSPPGWPSARPVLLRISGEECGLKGEWVGGRVGSECQLCLIRIFTYRSINIMNAIICVFYPLTHVYIHIGCYLLGGCQQGRIPTATSAVCHRVCRGLDRIVVYKPSHAFVNCLGNQRRRCL